MNKDTLREFYYGNINPSAMKINHGSTYEKTARGVCILEDKLRAVLDDESKALLDNLMKEQMNLDGLTAEENFIYGFRLGARFALEMMNEDSDGISLITE